jgi:hypothetical protein
MIDSKITIKPCPGESWYVGRAIGTITVLIRVFEKRKIKASFSHEAQESAVSRWNKLYRND